MKTPSLIVLVLSSLCMVACGSSHSFTGSSMHPRAQALVTVSPHLSLDEYTEAGVIEVVAESYADAAAHFQRIGGENGCHAVRPFTTRTNVFGGPNVTVSETIYLGSCLVPRSL